MGGLSYALTLGHRPPVSGGGSGPAFLPSSVPEVAAGYWWDSSLGISAPGTTAFSWAEQNGHAAFAQTQATVSAQPARVSGAGGDFHYATSSQTATAGSVKAGWTGDTYIAGYFRFPDAPGTGTFCRMFGHQTTATGRRRVIVLFTSVVANNVVQVSASWDGTSSTQLSVVHPTPTNWGFIECFLRPGNADANARRTILIDGSTPTTQSSSSAASFSTLNDPTEPLGVCTNPAVANTQSVEVAWMVYANGIPSDADRALLRAYRSVALGV